MGHHLFAACGPRRGQPGRHVHGERRTIEAAKEPGYLNIRGQGFQMTRQFEGHCGGGDERNELRWLDALGLFQQKTLGLDLCWTRLIGRRPCLLLLSSSTNTAHG